MALHNTQCPHCFITYVISDEQLRVSEGMVRCGTCRERFQARILKDEAEAPRFDPREVFIEPLTDERETDKREGEVTDNTEPQQYSFVDPDSELEKSVSLSEATVTDSINSELSIDIDENAPVTPLDPKQLSAAQMLANIRAKQQRETEQKEAIEASTSDKTKPRQTDIDDQINEVIKTEPTLPKISPKVRPKPPAPQKPSNDDLIDEVNTLVDYKLIKATSLANQNKESENRESKHHEPFALDKKTKSRSYSWLLAPPLLLVAGALACVLVYQLWIKQLVELPEIPIAKNKIIELTAPLIKELSQRDLNLPIRRNLNHVKLTSAITEAHPTRPSTTLLRISIINHALFKQPLPWLEMTLTDAEGRLVSRRNLSPSDYIYQNQTSDMIGARELKKVTIELLSFPKQATGYQIKVLNK